MTPRNFLAVVACQACGLVHAARVADRDHLEDADFTKTVAIVFSGTSATVSNEAGVTVAYGTSSSQIFINSAVEGVEYLLSGTYSDGYVEITSTYDSKVTLNGVSLTSNSGPALSMLSAARNFVVTANGSTNSLADTATYTRSGSGTLYTSGPMILSGKGSLSVAGIKSHAIYGGTSIRSMGGDVKVTAAAKDAIHSKTLFRMDQGSLDLTATGNGIDGDSGAIQINGGSISIRSTVDDTKAIGCEGLITFNGGSLNLTVNGVQSKGISGKSDIVVNGGTLAFNLAGAVFLETVTGTSTYVDPAYCTAMKCDGNLNVFGGNITITHTGIAGKGISSDGNIAITGGTLDIFTSGVRSASFTNSLGASDTASADCIDADGTLTISSGIVTALSTGIGGDCLSSDLALSVSGGTLSLTTDGVSGDCLSSNQTLAVSGGILTEASTNLANWSVSGVTLSSPDANGLRTASVPVETSSPTRFMRLSDGGLSVPRPRRDFAEPTKAEVQRMRCLATAG